MPGFLRPSACRRSRNDAWSDERAEDIGFSVRKVSGFDSAIAVVDDIGWSGEDQKNKDSRSCSGDGPKEASDPSQAIGTGNIGGGGNSGCWLEG